MEILYVYILTSSFNASFFPGCQCSPHKIKRIYTYAKKNRTSHEKNLTIMYPVTP